MLKGILKHVDKRDNSVTRKEPANDPKNGEDVWIVHDRIVERRGVSKQRKKAISSKPTTASHQTVEGYTPSTTVRFADTKQESNDDSDSNPHEEQDEPFTMPDESLPNNDDDEPLIFQSLSQMMAVAGTLPKDTEDPAVVEAELKFSVMQIDDYYEYKRQALEEQTENIIKTMPPTNNDDDTENSNPEETTTDDFWGVFDGSDDEETVPAAPPRAFLKLWTMMSQWVTPEAVQYVGTGDSTVPAKSDIEMSRCAALMNILRPHVGTIDLKRRQRLGELLRRFDYRYAMPDMAGLTKSLAYILLESLDNDTTTCNELQVPDVCAAVGLTLEEYTYLVRSGLRNFYQEQ